MKQPNLEYDKYYHIYNKGRRGENLFHENINYEYFLELYQKHISNICKTYAWALLGNHFHLLVKTIGIETKKPLHQYFSNLFNAYTKAINKKYNRYGPLFNSPFKRIEITSETYFKNLIYYIHYNPVHHNFVDNIDKYPWTSYNSIISNNSTIIERNEVLNWFNNDINEFIEFHKIKSDFNKIKNIIIE
ncbi:MAG: hypothetical protein A2X08_11015 [Bacteroidetes bacterium GWA2_32_17]|nr:MAG: hypothetical protein A2X08_11015 [Bacteroidetes bacterium GWA2_32_17]